MSDELAHDLLWQADGHLTDVALTALADGEVALLSPAAASHAEECDACACTRHSRCAWRLRS